MNDASALPRTNGRRKPRERKEKTEKGERGEGLPPCDCPARGPDFPSARVGVMSGNGSESSPSKRELEKKNPSRTYRQEMQG